MKLCIVCCESVLPAGNNKNPRRQMIRKSK
jgi:hypothetical protein